MRNIVLISSSFLLLCFSVIVRSAGLEGVKQDPPEELVAWILKAGGQADVIVRSVNPTGLRGLVAARDFQSGDTVVSLLYSIALNLGPASWSAAELAVSLLRMRYVDPDRWAFFQPYWDSLPAKGKVYGQNAFHCQHLPLLQDRGLEDSVEKVLNWTNYVYTQALASLKDYPDAAHVQADDLGHLAAVVDSYVFGFVDGKGQPARHMLPLLDMINHDGTDPNVAIVQDGAKRTFAAVALRAIRKGEQVTHRYSEKIARNDQALLGYFFIDRRRQPPLLCAVDLPGGSPDAVGEGAVVDDADHAPGGRHCTMEEAERLQSILDGFPTTEAEDRALLESTDLSDWRERLIVEWRVLRKEALRLTGAGIRAAQGLQHVVKSQHRQPVALMPDFSDDLQEPIFLQFGVDNGDEL